MTNYLVDPPTLYEASLEVEWVHPMLVEQVIPHLMANDYESYTLQRLASPYAWETINQSDNGLRGRPTHLLTSNENDGQTRLIFLSDSFGSYRAKFPPFPSWELALRSEMERFIALTFETSPNAEVAHLSLRFINAFSASAHQVKKVNDLNLSIEIGAQSIEDSVAISYITLSKDCEVTVRIASGTLVDSPPLHDTSVLVDIIVNSALSDAGLNDTAVHDWIGRAHTVGFETYFSLYTDAMRKRLIKNKPSGPLAN